MKYSLVLLTALVAAVKASPVALPQGVTAAISPTASPPAGCTPSFSGSFGIAVQNISTSATASAAKRQVTQASDGQPGAQTMAMVSMITDGQIQGSLHTMVVMPIHQIGDGQVQATTAVTVAPVTVISDGQPQAPKITISTSTAPAVSAISDGQPQAPTATTTTAPAVTELSEGQPQATTATRTAASELSEGQPEATTGTTLSTAATASASAVMVACASNDTLELTLADGILKDAHGRTGYIASNYQFQFDDPPQAGAIYTSGFSVCSNGSLALGGSNVFYQCLSGSFYNLYNVNWAAQCSPVTINTLKLVTCS